MLRRWLLCALLGAGCGANASEDDPQVSELSASALDDQCASWNARVSGDVLGGLCRIRGAVRAMLDPQLASMDPVVACEMETQRCMTAPPQADHFCPGALRSECNASVGDVDHCVEVSVDQWRMAASRTCEEQLVRVMQLRQGQLIDTVMQACEASDACFQPTFTVAPNGGVSTPPPAAGASGMGAAGGAGAGASGTSGTSGAGAGASGAGGASGAAGASGAGGASHVPGMPDAVCMATYPEGSQPCAECVCTPGTGCLELYQNCFENEDPVFEMLCQDVVTCMNIAGCVGSACYAPDRCQSEIDAAATYPAGGTIASCGVGDMDSSPCRAASLLSACAAYDAMMVDGPCFAACMPDRP